MNVISEFIFTEKQIKLHKSPYFEEHSQSSRASYVFSQVFCRDPLYPSLPYPTG